MRLLKGVLTCSAVLLLSVSAQTVSAQDSSNIRVDNESTTFIRPCFRLVEGGPWVNFGGIGPGGSFQWTDFMSIVEAARGEPAGSLDFAIIEFTYNDFFLGSCPTGNVKGTLKTNIQLDRETNFTLQIGKRSRAIELAGPGDTGR